MTLCRAMSFACVLPTPCDRLVLSYDADFVIEPATNGEFCCVYDVFGLWPTDDERADACRVLVGD